MSTPSFSHEQLVHRAKFNPTDFEFINTRRRDHNRLGFAYQLAFVRLANRFPTQQPFEVVEDILTFVSLQVDISADLIQDYQQRRQTIAEHQPQIVDYLGLHRFGETETNLLKQFLFEEALRLEQTGPLRLRALILYSNASLEIKALRPLAVPERPSQ